jgi:hypothetical protein
MCSQGNKTLKKQTKFPSLPSIFSYVLRQLFLQNLSQSKRRKYKNNLAYAITASLKMGNKGVPREHLSFRKSLPIFGLDSAGVLGLVQHLRLALRTHLRP